jgi:hypothetical protein
MPRAVAKVGDHIIAETDTWEVVEGNIYVCRHLRRLVNYPAYFG